VKRSEVEAWAYQVIERVVKKQPVEDDRVELKREMLLADKAARLIAGHANQASDARNKVGQPIQTEWNFHTTAYAVPGSVPTTIPNHKCSLAIEVPGILNVTVLPRLSLYDAKTDYQYQIVLDQAGKFEIGATRKAEVFDKARGVDSTAIAVLRIGVAGSDRDITQRFVLPFYKVDGRQSNGNYFQRVARAD
jgi:hypothetical protein